jgi:epoxyqueuosine reductase
MTTSISEAAREEIRARSRALGFDACGFADADAPWEASARLARFLADGRQGTMDWMRRTAARRAHPRALWPAARSAVVLGVNYGPDRDPLEALAERDRAAISVYAKGRDYHGLLKGRLKQLAGEIARRHGGEVKVFVDTAPLMEKPLAERAGLGWQGKHTNLVSRDFGSWLFLGVILIDRVLPPDPPETDHCGSCRACLDVCPTGAFVGPYQLDARACLSYLTIEHAGPWREEHRRAMGNRVFGCDDCLAVCPWNKYASVAHESALHAREDLRGPALAELAGLDDAGFRARFSANPVKRIGRNQFLRNVLYAIGNSGDPALSGAASAKLGEPDETVRDAAAWAAARLGATAPRPATRA